MIFQLFVTSEVQKGTGKKVWVNSVSFLIPFLGNHRKRFVLLMMISQVFIRLKKLQSDLRETMSVHSDNAQKLMAAVDTLDTEVRDNVRKLMSEVARNQTLLADTLNSIVRQTLDTGKLLLTLLET